MLEILTVILFCWLFCKTLGLVFRVAWCTTKILACMLLALALPMLAAGALFAGGVLLLLPLLLVGIVFGLLKALV